MLYSSVFPKCWVNRFPSSNFAVSEAGAHILDIGGESTRPGVGKSSLVCSIISSSPYLFLDSLISHIENCQVQLKCRWKKRPGSNLFLPMSLCLCHASSQVKRVVPVIQGIREAVFYDVWRKTSKMLPASKTQGLRKQCVSVSIFGLQTIYIPWWSQECLQKFRLKNLCRMESYRIDVYLKSMSLRHGLRWKAGIDATISIDTRKAQIRIANLRSAIKSMKSRKPMFSTKTKWFSKGLAKYHVWVLAYSILKVL